MTPRTLVTVVGARPQFIKAAPVTAAIQDHRDLCEIIVHTGQHHDDAMSDVFFRELDLPAPHVQLGICGGTHGEMTGRMLEALEHVLLEIQPDGVLVYGDTNSSLAGALSAAKLHIPVIHVEAGLRSFDRRMPEELNRVLVDHLSTLLFAPTRSAVANLRDEGIRAGVVSCGDVMYDVSLAVAKRAATTSSIVARLGLQPKRYYLATVHRAENTDTEATLRRVVQYLEALTSRFPVVLPLHPRTAAAAARFGIDLSSLTVCAPVGPVDMAQLLAAAVEVYTDSGGLQKEAYFLRVPCVTLRDATEWVETVDAGWNRLWTDQEFRRPRQEIDEYGDGAAAPQMARHIAECIEALPKA